MNLHLRDKVVIVTGSGAGIGGAITLQLAREGALLTKTGSLYLFTGHSSEHHLNCPAHIGFATVRRRNR